MVEESPKSDASEPAPARGDPAEHTSPGHSHLDLPQFQGLLAKLKQRHVGRVALLYIGVCYLILEPFEMFFHLLELPAWTGRVVVLLMALGFPVTLLLAWVWQVKPTESKAGAGDKQTISLQTGRKLDRAIIVVLAAALVYFVADKFLLHEAKQEPAVVASPVASPAAVTETVVSEKSVAVLPFVDMSERKDQEYFSDGLSEELIDMLTKIPDLHVPGG